MLTPVYRTASFLSQLVARLPIGTNLGMLRLLWMVLAGALLPSRGAIFPALIHTGLSDAQARQAEAALRVGQWKVSHLRTRFGWLVNREHLSKPVPIGRLGYRPLLIDYVHACVNWVGFFRPHLHDCDSSHYSSQAGKALLALEFGMVASVQQVEDRRIPQLLALNRTGDTVAFDTVAFDTVALLRLAQTKQTQKDVIVADRQVKMSHIEEAQVQRFVIRGPQNLSARTSSLPYLCKKQANGEESQRAALWCVRPTDSMMARRSPPPRQTGRSSSFTTDVPCWRSGLSKLS